MRRLVFFILLCGGMILSAQKMTAWQYIETYKDLAIKEMNRTGIPASITLAQGMLESGNGNSTLARKANNHFGIKCHNWDGPKVYHDDDRRNECFRKYKTVYHSYVDHSDFLSRTSRYSSLFELKSTDYKSWAHGLKKAGYATARDYDRKLIDLIEKYNLHKFDTGNGTTKHKHVAQGSLSSTSGNHKIEMRNNIKYILAKEGDTYESITNEFDLMKWQIARYNEIAVGSEINPGTVLYLQPKRRKAAHGKKYHIVKEGENMYYISQLYGIKLSELYRKNLMKEGTQPELGQKIHLRKRMNGIIPESEEEDFLEPVMRFEFDEE